MLVHPCSGRGETSAKLEAAAPVESQVCQRPSCRGETTTKLQQLASRGQALRRTLLRLQPQVKLPLHQFWHAAVGATVAASLEQDLTRVMSLPSWKQSKAGAGQHADAVSDSDLASADVSGHLADANVGRPSDAAGHLSKAEPGQPAEAPEPKPEAGTARQVTAVQARGVDASVQLSAAEAGVSGSPAPSEAAEKQYEGLPAPPAADAALPVSKVFSAVAGTAEQGEGHADAGAASPAAAEAQSADAAARQALHAHRKQAGQEAGAQVVGTAPGGSLPPQGTNKPHSETIHDVPAASGAGGSAEAAEAAAGLPASTSSNTSPASSPELAVQAPSTPGSGSGEDTPAAEPTTPQHTQIPSDSLGAQMLQSPALAGASPASRQASFSGGIGQDKPPEAAGQQALPRGAHAGEAPCGPMGCLLQVRWGDALGAWPSVRKPACDLVR